MRSTQKKSKYEIYGALVVYFCFQFLFVPLVLWLFWIFLAENFSNIIVSVSYWKIVIFWILFVPTYNLTIGNLTGKLIG